MDKKKQAVHSIRRMLFSMTQLVVDNVTYEYEGELAVDKPIYVVDADGVATAAPDGVIEAENATITVANGIVTEITEKAEPTEEEMADETPEEVAEEVETIVTDNNEALAGIIELVETVIAENEVLTEKVEELTTTVEELKANYEKIKNFSSAKSLETVEIETAPLSDLKRKAMQRTEAINSLKNNK